MALIKWSGMVSEIKGKLNGSIFSNPTYGAQMRNRKSCKGKNSAVWGASKSILSVVASEWKSLTNVQRQSFVDQAPHYPYVNKFGDSVEPSGYQLYCTLNLNLRKIGVGQLTTAIAKRTEVDISPFVFQVSAGGALELTYTSPSSALVQLLVYCSPPVSPGVYYPPRKMAFIKQINGSSSSPQDIDSAVEEKYGAVSDGQKYFLRVEIIDILSGQRYGDYFQSLLVSGHA